MNNKVNYGLVGFIVLVGMFLMFVFSYWLLKPSDELQMKKYIIHFDESVLGLNIDAPVKYRGIDVGKVIKLSINPKNTEQIEALIDISKTTPVKEDTLAKLTSQGITGLSYINLSLGKNTTPELKVFGDNKYPIIKTTPSLFAKLESSFSDVTEGFSDTLIKTNRLLNNENQKQFSLVLKETASFMQNMNKLLDDEMIENLQNSAKNLDSTTAKLDVMIPYIDKFIESSITWEDNISNSFSSIMESYLGIKSSMDEFKRAMSSGEFNIKEITNDTIPIINNAMLEMQALMIKVEDSLNKYDRSPSDILFRQEEIKKGPGE
ncbi:MAG: MlaD family protein [Campylobacterota bacterium]|nr:MlaD family protein [Campylobacterota bacterium]